MKLVHKQFARPPGIRFSKGIGLILTVAAEPARKAVPHI
jgi:hypothetical protein